MGAWRYAAASVVGTSHVAAGVPCQDHAMVTSVPVHTPPAALLAVASDGAGSAAFAADGAEEACRAFMEYAGLGMPLIGHRPDMAADFEARSLDDVRANIERVAGERGAAIGAFACTLLGAVVGDDAALFFQVGDGAIVYRIEDGGWRVAIAPERGGYVNETDFVTRRDAAAKLRMARVLARVSEIALVTDGIEMMSIDQKTGTAHGPFFEHVIGALRGEAAGHSAAHSDWLAGFLDSAMVNRRTDDDKTIVVASRLAG